MVKLIKAECFKLQKLYSFPIILLLTLAIGIMPGFSSYTGCQVYSLGLIPELFDAVLISVFTADFVCMEFSNRTFGNAFLCGTSRKNVFLAKLVVYFLGLLILILIPMAASTAVATLRNGFGADWNGVALEIESEILVYILYRFSMAGFAILVASVIRNPIGTIGISSAGIYLVTLTQNPMENSAAQDMYIVLIIKTAILLSVATFIFVRRDLKSSSFWK